MLCFAVMKIGIMGVEGSFSEQAGKQYGETLGSPYTIEYLVNAERVLTAVENGTVDRGVFPIENSNGGIVIEAVYAMAKHRFGVEKMFEIEVKQNLLVIPGTKASDITLITSHDQAIKQCRMYLKRAWGGVELKEYEDTALAAKHLHDGTLPKTAAVIASKGAAELYGLEILEEGIQDLKYNYTMFVVATKIPE